MYILRLDDASEHMNLTNWYKVKKLLDKYNIKPIYGIIPDNQDPELVKNELVFDFWQLMKKWADEGWIPALHGCNHVFVTSEGGLNPIHRRSEFAGMSLDSQREKIRRGYRIMLEHNVKPSVFFAPAHTFDEKTLQALADETEIRVISDTVSNNVYYRDPFFFIPQQSGRVRRLPFKVVTFCYHPNTMEISDFHVLERFLKLHSERFTRLDIDNLDKRKKDSFDKLLGLLYNFRQILFARK